MADYYTHFSCLLVVDSAADAETALAHYETLAAQMEEADEGDIGFALEVQVEGEVNALWMHDDGHGDPDHVIIFVQHLTEKMELSGLCGPVAVWCRSFDHVMCSKGDEPWAQAGRMNFARMRCGSR